MILALFIGIVSAQMVAVQQFGDANCSAPIYGQSVFSPNYPHHFPVSEICQYCGRSGATTSLRYSLISKDRIDFCLWSKLGCGPDMPFACHSLLRGQCGPICTALGLAYGKIIDIPEETAIVFMAGPNGDTKTNCQDETYLNVETHSRYYPTLGRACNETSDCYNRKYMFIDEHNITMGCGGSMQTTCQNGQCENLDFCVNYAPPGTSGCITANIGAKSKPDNIWIGPDLGTKYRLVHFKSNSIWGSDFDRAVITAKFGMPPATSFATHITTDIAVIVTIIITLF
jgi:hypothetical protein